MDGVLTRNRRRRKSADRASVCGARVAVWALLPSMVCAYGPPLIAGRQARPQMDGKPRACFGEQSHENAWMRQLSPMRGRHRRWRHVLWRVSGGGPSDAQVSGDAEDRVEAVLRKLVPSELDSIRDKLGLEDTLQGVEDIIAHAVPVLAAKVQAKESSQDVRYFAGEDNVKRRAEEWNDDGAEENIRMAGAERNMNAIASPGDRASRHGREKPDPYPPLASGQRAYFATCPRGLETVLRDELVSPSVGAKMVRRSGRGCHFYGDQAVGYKAVLWLRTAHRVLELIGDGDGHPIDGSESLYEAAADIQWSRFMHEGQTLSVDAILGVVADGLTHSHFTALTVKNAVVDQFRSKGQRPSVNTDNPDLPLVVYVDRGRALLYRSLSGTRSMHKRGYRSVMHAAALKENVAAGLLLASGWDPTTQVLADPMCGSGTFLIEAALIAMRRAPGLVAMGAFPGTDGGRSGGSNEAGWRPAVSSWPDFNAELWKEVMGQALQVALPRPPSAIMGNDWHPGALSLAWRDAKAAGVEDYVTLYDEDASMWRPPMSVDLAVANPPWDNRLERDAERSWHGLLEFLRRELGEKDAWVLSGNPSLSRVLRMKSEQNMYLATGGLELRWLKYHLHEYRGDRRRGGRGKPGPRPKKVSRAYDRPAVDRW